MGHVNLGGDSESTDESLDATMAGSEENVQLNDSEPEEIAQVQLRSGKILRSPPKKEVSNKDKEKEIVINDDIIPEDPKKKKTSANGIDYNILSHLRKIPAQLSIYDALVMSKDLRETLIQALKDPERYKAYFAERSLTEVLQARNEPFITFSEEDMMLGTADHNRPLYVTAKNDKLIISRILIDLGSSVNLISLKALRSLYLDVEHLGPDKMMVHCFNEKGQKTLGSFMLPLVFGELHMVAKFNVIDVDISFKALLGHPWLHEYGIVPSTLHQCMKYLEEGEEFRISGDIQPFTVHEATVYEDARYFMRKKQKSSSSLEAKASNSKTTKRPEREGQKELVGRKKSMPVNE
ncbi:uncharacterized protein LOC114579342 [Dendrobium catenatum]|uniref:uncharacterized protein LOC114579342 n=1 Tax=Dendrobium catenatum TaxID=906689 RepID=UPI00109F77BF|nr:uncharacterized protein LOC114579342 [Dendrobium catenatum]